MVILEIGRVYPKDEPTVSLELNLEDLYWLQGFISYRNGFWRDLQDGIDAIEERNRILDETPAYGLNIVVVEKNNPVVGSVRSGKE